MMHRYDSAGGLAAIWTFSADEAQTLRDAVIAQHKGGVFADPLLDHLAPRDDDDSFGIVRFRTEGDLTDRLAALVAAAGI
jgi:hypothetical protein